MRDDELRSHGRVAAFFDFDDTIIEGNSFHLFGRYLTARYRNMIPRLAAGILLRWLRQIDALQFKRIVLRPLVGLTREDIERLGADFYRHRIRGAIRPGAIRRLHDHTMRGHQVHVLSGAFEFVLAPFCQEFGISSYRGTKLQYPDGRFSGDLHEGEFLGQAKADYIRELARNSGVNLAASYAYSDHVSDLPMLELVGTGVFVNLGEAKQVRGKLVERW